MEYKELVVARIETLVALHSLSAFVSSYFYADEVTDELVSSMEIMINEYLSDMGITNVELECIYFGESSMCEGVIPVMKFVWTDLDDVNQEHLELDQALARIEYKNAHHYKYGM